MRQLRIAWIRRQYLLFGMMAKKPNPQPIVDHWFDAALQDKAIRRDLIRYARTRFDKADLFRATRAVADFNGDVLVLWSHNPVMLDQPEQTAREIGAFLTAG